MRAWLALAVVAAMTAGGCSSPGPPEGIGQAAVPSPSKTLNLPPAVALAVRAAQAQDQYYAATYRFTPADGSPAGTARVERSRQGFLLEVSEPADAARLKRATIVVTNNAGTFRCRLTSAARACVSAARAGEASDPVGAARMQLAFTSWLRTLADQSAALSVTGAKTPHGTAGTCFAVDGVAAALDPPVDPGLYCFDGVGRITALRLAQGTLTVTGFAAAPATVALPAPVGKSLPQVEVPRPTPTPATSGAPAPGATRNPVSHTTATP
jgi:hypothetical protein